MTNGRGGWEFDAVVEPLPWGRNVYTVLRLDPALESAARDRGTRRVEGTIEETAVNLGINRADVIADSFVYLGKQMQRRLGVVPGDVVSCELRPADPEHVPVPDDVASALEDRALSDAFAAMPAAERRRLLQPIESAARAATRERRVSALIEQVGGR
ncbi:YdeI/OmpD-associated family protein [Nocardioides kribbensis]|uniref:YdeI/OmpD-associated family protein n=1 Tax=Nocardioides kribbensis TaxID=305517 RepID=A0ABV1NUR5_9ACTN